MLWCHRISFPLYKKSGATHFRASHPIKTHRPVSSTSIPYVGS
nr:MAG TPA: hypothetical protein [Caudoviricetes sp.]